MSEDLVSLHPTDDYETRAANMLRIAGLDVLLQISGVKNYVTVRDRIERVLEMYNEIDQDANLRAALEVTSDPS
jgi:hypothetical protein